MGILAWMVVGLSAGWLAGLIMGNSSTSLFGEIVVGIIGGLIGGFLGSVLFTLPTPTSNLSLTSIFIASLGSITLIALIRMLGGRCSAV